MSDEAIARHLGEALSAGEAALFTGAGFSVDARAADGRPIPSGLELADELWEMCFPGEERDGSGLEDLFQHALAEKPDELAALLRRRLTVDPGRLPAFYATWFSLPWRRIYTLNVDDLATACAARFQLPRPISVVSACARAAERGDAPEGALEIVHLNGHVEDAPRGMTFSTTQYGARLAAHTDAHYSALMEDFYALSFVFVGTRLDESPLWQALQRAEGCPAGEEPSRPRPRSFLITPQIERARQSLLERLGVEWVPLSTRDFTERVLEPLVAARRLDAA